MSNIDNRHKAGAIWDNVSGEVIYPYRWYNSARFTMEGLRRFDVSPEMIEAAYLIEASYQLSSYTT